MVIVFLQSYHIWVNLDARSGQGQVNEGLILTFLIWGKQRHVSDAEYPKDSNGAIYFFSLCGTAFQKVVFYCMTSQLDVALNK